MRSGQRKDIQENFTRLFSKLKKQPLGRYVSLLLHPPPPPYTHTSWNYKLKRITGREMLVFGFCLSPGGGGGGLSKDFYPEAPPLHQTLKILYTIFY